MSSVLHSLTGLLVTVAIPIVAILGGISYAAYSMYLRFRRQREMLQMHHAERMAAIEKGIELPPMASEIAHDPSFDIHRGYGGVGMPPRRRYRGLITLLVGIAITVAMWQTDGDNSFWWGLIIVAAGLGQLLIGSLESRDRGRSAGIPRSPGGPPSPGQG